MINIILVIYNNDEMTYNCIDSIVQNLNEYKIFIVDNSSEKYRKDNKLDFSTFPMSQKRILEKELNSTHIQKNDGILLVRSNQNYGYGGGVNVVFRKLFEVKKEDEYIWLLNNDTEIKNGADLALKTKLDEISGNGLVGNSVYYLSDKSIVQYIGGGRLIKPWMLTKFNRKPGKIDFLVGTSLFMNIRFAKKIGLYPENYFLYYEDIAYSFNALKAGGELAVAETAIIYHSEGGSDETKQKSGDKSIVTDFYSLRNRILFAQEYFPQYVIFAWLTLLVSFMKRIARGKWEKARLILHILIKQPFMKKEPLKLKSLQKAKLNPFINQVKNKS